MRESLFSNQVIQPFLNNVRESFFSNQVIQPYLNNAFPLHKKTHEDRLFKHVTFFDQDKSSYRIRAINHNWHTASELVTRSHSLEIHPDFWNKEVDKVRLKAVLSSPIEGVQESHWVAQRHEDYSPATSFNQYRVRGYSDKGYISDWVYSEIRDNENDLIVFQLLHDLMDMLLTVNDVDLEYLVDYYTKDVFQTIFKSGIPKAEQGIFPEETMRAQLEEITSIFSSMMKKELNETILSSPEELAELAKAYQILERYREAKTDFMTFLFESFIEEKYEKVVQKTNLEVLMRNDEEMHLLLESVFDFNIKAELIRTISDVQLDERFVTAMNDAVQLISEPIVFESLVSRPEEDVAKFLRMALQEIYVPLMIMDQRGVEIQHDLEDQLGMKPKSALVEFETSGDGGINRYLMVFDFIKLILEELGEPLYDFELEIVEKIIQSMNGETLALYIEYSPVEFIEMLTAMSENFLLEYSTLPHVQKEETSIFLQEDITGNRMTGIKESNESKQANLQEAVIANDMRVYGTLLESYYVKHDEMVQIQDTIEGNLFSDELYLQLVDHIVSAYQTEDTHQHESISVQQKESASLVDTSSYHEANFNQRVSLIDSFIQKDTRLYWVFRERKSSITREAFHVLYKPNPLDNFLYRMLEFKEQEVNVHRHDYYIMKGDETVRYMLGELTDGWPLGEFILGTNTLRGQSNSTTG